MKVRSLTSYGIIALIIIIADRLSKAWALRLAGEKVVNQFLSFSLTFNRGINWGFFNSNNPLLFTIINIVIAGVIVGLLGYTYFCWKLKQPIFAHVLILAGAVSNYFDRIMHGGVIDFIVFSWGTWSWPAFNIADAAICLGVGLMVLISYKNWL